MEHTSGHSARCIFCESADIYSLPAVIAGDQWPVCKLCAGAGRTLLDEGRLQPVLHCLHLVAMELEAFAEGYETHEDRTFRKWLYRLRRNFGRGLFRELCPCSTFFRPGEFVVVVDAFDTFGVERETTAETMPLLVLRSMPDHANVPSSNGGTVKARDAVKARIEANHIATKRPPVGPLARVAQKAAAKRNGSTKQEDLNRYAAARKKFGPGHLQGDWWITDADGECHYWPKRDRKGPRK